MVHFVSNYSFLFKGYLKVTVMVLGPGDEAPVSWNEIYTFYEGVVGLARQTFDVMAIQGIN